VAILATLDTKLEPAVELAGLLTAMGAVPVVIDLSVRSSVEIPQELAVIRAGQPLGASSAGKLESMDRTVGAARVQLSDLIRGGACAAIGLGGGQGTALCLEVLEAASAIERVMVTTSPRGVTFNESTAGLVLVHSITDIAGGNPYLSRCLAAAAASALGARTYSGNAVTGPVVFMSMLGVTTKGVQHTETILREHASVAVFHANGLGGMAMERKLATDPIAAVLDFTTGELTSEVAGGTTTAGPDRLTTAGNMGVPQLVVPGGTDMIILRDGADLAMRFGGRPTIRHTGSIVLLRANAREMSQVGALTAERLNASHGPVKVLVPELGFSEHDHPEERFFDPEADMEYVKALRRHAKSHIEVRTVPLHINDPAFAAKAAEMLLELAPNLPNSHH
jgi:uncharacterized protein (UPF0261 family)